MVNTAHKEQQEVREQILEAAMERFKQFGYGKTTMAEIAADCNMSAANLYRYFESKNEIAANLCRQCMQECVCQVQNSCAESTASQALEGFILETFRFKYQQWTEMPRISEIVHTIMEGHHELIEEYKRNKKQVLMEILQRGVDSGEFRIDDLQRTAESILMATIVFDVPIFMHLYPKETFEAMAKDIAQLMINGLLAR